MKVDTDFQVDVSDATKNNTTEKIATITTATSKSCYPSGKELFCNFGDDFTDDDKWLNNGNPFPLLLDSYSHEEVEMKANTIKKQIEKPQKKSVPQKMYNGHEFSEIKKLKEENLRLKKLLMQRKRQKNITAMLKRRNNEARTKKNVCKHSVNEFLNGKKSVKPVCKDHDKTSTT